MHAALALGPWAPLADGRLHLIAVDVGQGDGLLLRSPSGRAIVVDAGGSRDPRFDPGERRMAPELWRAGVRRLDAVVVSHAHPDHAGGVPFLLRAFQVGDAPRRSGGAPGPLVAALGLGASRGGGDAARRGPRRPPATGTAHA